jgi:hypothetical protein
MDANPAPDDPKKRTVIVNKTRMQLAAHGKKPKWLYGPFSKCGPLSELLYNENIAKGAFLRPFVNVEKNVIEFESVPNQQVRDMLRELLKVEGSKEDFKCAARQYMSEKSVNECIFKALFPTAKRQRDDLVTADTNKTKRAKASANEAEPANAQPAKVKTKAANQLVFPKQGRLQPRNLAAQPNFDYDPAPDADRSPKVSTPLRQLEKHLEKRGIGSLLESPVDSAPASAEDVPTAAMQQAITSVRMIVEINPHVINATFQKALTAFVTAQTQGANVEAAKNLSAATTSLHTK